MSRRKSVRVVKWVFLGWLIGPVLTGAALILLTGSNVVLLALAVGIGAGVWGYRRERHPSVPMDNTTDHYPTKNW